MVWEIKEVGNCVLKENGVIALTDDELINLYTLLAYSSSSIHRAIANKLSPIAEVAKHSRHMHNTWENEGGAIVNGPNSSSPSGHT